MRHTPASSRGNSAPNTPPLSILTAEDKDVFNLPAVEALRLMARAIEVLVSFTGDIPPTPPLSQPTSPALSAVNDKGLQTPSESPNMDSSTLNAGFSFGSEGSCDLDGVKVKKHSSKPTGEEEGKFIAAGVDNAIQHGAITRKFWSKSVPEIPIEDYIFRIHRFCPMSTAVYIAASVYLHRLAVVDRILPITRYNVHRLVLASLRVASKACEDLSHSHKRFAKVGGLSENELSRLEVSFCFLVNFELQISKSVMDRQVAALRNIAATQVMMGKPALQPRMPKDIQRRPTTVYVDC
ncbi:cyclin-domain-containing protein [Terfezia claveryi]|nr:cyclin-domain-containing protein [Terfezia claveryi]